MFTRPRLFVTFYISALEILLLAYLLNYCRAGKISMNLGKTVLGMAGMPVNICMMVSVVKWTWTRERVGIRSVDP